MKKNVNSSPVPSPIIFRETFHRICTRWDRREDVSAEDCKMICEMVKRQNLIENIESLCVMVDIFRDTRIIPYRILDRAKTSPVEKITLGLRARSFKAFQKLFDLKTCLNLIARQFLQETNQIPLSKVDFSKVLGAIVGLQSGITRKKHMLLKRVRTFVTLAKTPTIPTLDICCPAGVGEAIHQELMAGVVARGTNWFKAGALGNAFDASTKRKWLTEMTKCGYLESNEKGQKARAYRRKILPNA